MNSDAAFQAKLAELQSPVFRRFSTGSQSSEPSKEVAQGAARRSRADAVAGSSVGGAVRTSTNTTPSSLDGDDSPACRSRADAVAGMSVGGAVRTSTGSTSGRSEEGDEGSARRSRAGVVAGSSVGGAVRTSTNKTPSSLDAVTGNSIGGAVRTSTNKTPSSLEQLRQRNAEVLRIVQEKLQDSQVEESGDLLRLEKERDEMNRRLLTQETTDKNLEQMCNEQLLNIDQMKQGMAKVMSDELEKMRGLALQDFDGLKHSVERHVEQFSSLQQQKSAEQHAARMDKLRAEVQEALKGAKQAEEEVSNFRVELASVEERTKMMQERQEELHKDRTKFEDEANDLRKHSEQNWQKLMTAEMELQRFKTEAAMQTGELSRIATKHKEQDEAASEERASCLAREEEMLQEKAKLQAQLEEVKSQAELRALHSNTEQQEAVTELRHQVERLQADVSSRAQQLAEAQAIGSSLAEETEVALQREEAFRQDYVLQIRQIHEEIERSRNTEAELMEMLSGIQTSVMRAPAAAQAVAMHKGSHKFA